MGKRKYFTEEERIKAKKDNYKKYYQNNTQTILKQQKIYRKNNIEKRKEYYRNDKESHKLYGRKYFEEHKEQLKLKRKIRHYNRLKIDINYKIACNLRIRLNKAFKGNQKSGSAIEDLGCSIPEFKLYLESKFQSGMTWENWSRTGWHIDHIIPLSSFNLENREEFLKACHYTNLQPLWAEENFRKGNRLDNP